MKLITLFLCVVLTGCASFSARTRVGPKVQIATLSELRTEDGIILFDTPAAAIEVGCSEVIAFLELAFSIASEREAWIEAVRAAVGRKTKIADLPFRGNDEEILAGVLERGKAVVRNKSTGLVVSHIVMIRFEEGHLGRRFFLPDGVEIMDIIDLMI